MKLDDYMQTLVDEIGAHFDCLRGGMYNEGAKNVVVEAMFYSLEVGGKRIRPVLLLMLLDAFNVSRHKGIEVALALEMIHTYSLIHDDLPAMDDDDLRRGKPTNHKVYGEAIAILAGDGLLTDAFEVITMAHDLSVDVRLQLISMLARAAGSGGMIQGQNLDMEAEEKLVSLEELKQIHECKTGKLIEFACLAAGIIADLPKETLDDLSKFANHLGLAFQIQDDILDVCGDEALIGKKVGSDAINQKSTYVTLLGLEAAKTMLEEQTNQALATLGKLPADVVMLKELTLYVSKRDR